MNMSATKQDRMQLDNLKWETSTEYNYGVDVSTFGGRLRFTFDYYRKYIEDLLQKEYKLPSSSSFWTVKYSNSGKMENKGGNSGRHYSLENKKIGPSVVM